MQTRVCGNIESTFIPAIIAAVLLVGCAAQPQGRIDGDFYSPPRGDLRCEIMGGAQYGRISEEYSKYGGVVVFRDDMFTYRVDFQVRADPSKPLPSDPEDFAAAQKEYLHSSALPLTLKNYPGGKLVHEGTRNDGKRDVYVGVLYYSKPGQGRTLATTGPHYKVVVVHLTQPFAYTVTRDDLDRSDVGQSKEKNIEQAIEFTFRDSKQCTFHGE